MHSGRRPWVGPAVTDRFTMCAYSATPTSPPCTVRARTHVRVAVAADRHVGLATCDDHADVARGIGALVDEHPFEPGYCSRTDALWSAAGCVVEVTDLTPDHVGDPGDPGSDDR